MTLPLTTTTVTIETPADSSDDFYTTDTWTTFAAAVPAHISGPSGRETRIGGEVAEVDAVLFVDPGVGLARTHRVTDDATGTVYLVTWLIHRTGLGLDHVKAGLSVAVGVGR